MSFLYMTSDLAEQLFNALVAIFFVGVETQIM